MNSKIVIVFLMSLGMGASHLFSEAKVPLIRNAPDTAAWIITIQGSSAGDGKSSPPALKEVRVTKTPGARRFVFSWSDGRSTEKWLVGGYLLQEYPGNSAIYVEVLKSNSLITADEFIDLESDFPEFEWVSNSEFSSTAEYESKSCDIFRRVASSAPVHSGMGVQLGKRADKSRTAWIDTASRLPVALDDGVSLRKYSFVGAESAVLELPPRFKAVLQEYKQAIEKPRNHRMKP